MFRKNHWHKFNHHPYRIVMMDCCASIIVLSLITWAIGYFSGYSITDFFGRITFFWGSIIILLTLVTGLILSIYMKSWKCFGCKKTYADSIIQCEDGGCITSQEEVPNLLKIYPNEISYQMQMKREIPKMIDFFLADFSANSRQMIGGRVMYYTKRKDAYTAAMQAVYVENRFKFLRIFISFISFLFPPLRQEVKTKDT